MLQNCCVLGQKEAGFVTILQQWLQSVAKSVALWLFTLNLRSTFKKL